MWGDGDEQPRGRVRGGPRGLRVVQWAEERLVSDRADGWLPVAVEARGERTVAGVALNGRADRIDARDGALRIVDYKTGKPPSTRQLKTGFALQLGLLGWLADQGAFRSEERGVGKECVSTGRSRWAACI